MINKAVSRGYCKRKLSRQKVIYTFLNYRSIILRAIKLTLSFLEDLNIRRPASEIMTAVNTISYAV